MAREEADIQKAILEYLTWGGIFCWRNQTQGVMMGGKRIRSQSSGAPDILGILPGGRLLAIEVKTPKGRVQENQESFLYMIGLAGGLAFVARSLEDVKLRGKEIFTDLT